MATTEQPQKSVGSPQIRKEDPELITGRSRFVDDITVPGMLWAHVVRSPFAHARINGVDVSKALAMEGCVAAYSGADLASEWAAPLVCAWPVTDDIKMSEHWPLAKDKARHAGDGVAVVVAESRALAKDAAELVEVDWEPLPAVTDPLAAMEDGAPLVHDDFGTNVSSVWGFEKGDSPAPFKSSKPFFDDPDLVKVKHRYRLKRLIPNAMEPRGVIVEPNVAMGEYTMYTASQIPHIVRTTQAITCGIAEAKLRVVAPDVGGGFGSKLDTYAEESICLALARRLNRPIKWTEERSEGYVATIHGRDLYTDMEMAATRDGVLKAVRVNVWCAVGAYHQIVTPGIQMLSAWLYGGLYDVEGYDFEYTNIYTHTTPTDAYRGAGRPEATYAVERTMDLLARELGIDPAELRRKNYIPTDRFPNFTIASGLTVDSGDYPLTHDAMIEALDYDDIRRQQAERRQSGSTKHIGVGLSCWTEMCGLAPSRVLAALKYVAGGWDAATIEMLPTGTVRVLIGVTPHGQGHVTTFSQIVADQLGVDFEDVEVLHGDTQVVPLGHGHLRQPLAHGRGRRHALRRREGHRQGAHAGGPPARGQRGRPRLHAAATSRSRAPTSRSTSRPSPSRPGPPTTCPTAWSRASRPPTSTTRPTSRGPTAPTPAWSRWTPRPAASTSSGTSPSTTAEWSSTRWWSRARCTAAWPRASPRPCSRRPPTTRRATSSREP